MSKSLFIAIINLFLIGLLLMLLYSIKNGSTDYNPAVILIAIIGIGSILGFLVGILGNYEAKGNAIGIIINGIVVFIFALIFGSIFF